MSKFFAPLPDSSVVADRLVAPPSIGQTTKRYGFRRRELFPYNQGLWRIESGVVRVVTFEEDGTLIALSLWDAGKIVGPSLSQIRPYNIESLTDVVAVAIPASYCYFDQVQLSHFQQAEELLRIVRISNAEKRLQQFLLWVFQAFGNETDQGWILSLLLTHQEIAEIIGLTRVTVTRLINHLQREGFVAWSKERRVLFHQAARSYVAVASAADMAIFN